MRRGTQLPSNKCDASKFNCPSTGSGMSEWLRTHQKCLRDGFGKFNGESLHAKQTTDLLLPSLSLFPRFLKSLSFFFLLTFHSDLRKNKTFLLCLSRSSLRPSKDQSSRQFVSRQPPLLLGHQSLSGPQDSIRPKTAAAAATAKTTRITRITSKVPLLRRIHQRQLDQLQLQQTHQHRPMTQNHLKKRLWLPRISRSLKSR